MNGIFFGIVVIAFIVAAYRQITWIPSSADDASPMDQLAIGMIDTAESSVTLAIGLIGVMALFLGLMKVAEAGGLLVIIAKLLRPLMIRLFPDVPADHPAMGAMILNMSANALGLGNAATPFGIRAMQELDKLNPHKGTATNAMALFLAINTSSVTLLPTGVIALRAAAGSTDAAGIVPTTLVATIFSTITAIIMAKLLQKYFPATPADARKKMEAGLAQNATAPGTNSELDMDMPDVVDGAHINDTSAYPGWVSMSVLAAFLGIVPLTVIYGKSIAPWIIPSLMVLLLGFGVAKGVRVYESFVEGARDGFQVAVKIIPFLVAILVAVGMFRASGAMGYLVAPLGAVTQLFGMPAEALPMALLRPLSGSGAYGILASIINDPNIGPDSYTGYLVSTIQGSTETTFYVLAVYFGAVQIKRVRHAIIAALSADLAGIIGAVVICLVLYGSLA